MTAVDCMHRDDADVAEKSAAEVHDEGYLAHMDGYPESDNPYSCERNEDLLWLAGYRASAAEHAEELAHSESGTNAQ